MLGRPFISNIQVVSGDKNLPVCVCIRVSQWYRQKEITLHFSKTLSSRLITNLQWHITVNIGTTDPGNRTRQCDILARCRSQLGWQGSVFVPCHSSSFQRTAKPSTCRGESLKSASQPSHSRPCCEHAPQATKKGVWKQALQTLTGSLVVWSAPMLHTDTLQI